MAKPELHIIHPSPTHSEVKNSYSQSINNFPEDITYFHDNHYLGLTIGAGFQVNRVNARLHVLNIKSSETAKPLRGRHFTGRRCKPSVYLVPLEPEFRRIQGT